MKVSRRAPSRRIARREGGMRGLIPTQPHPCVWTRGPCWFGACVARVAMRRVTVARWSAEGRSASQASGWARGRASGFSYGSARAGVKATTGQVAEVPRRQAQRARARHPRAGPRRPAMRTVAFPCGSATAQGTCAGLCHCREIRLDMRVGPRMGDNILLGCGLSAALLEGARTAGRRDGLRLPCARSSSMR